MPPRPTTSRTAMSYARVLAFMGGFAALFVFVVYYYLIPATEAFGQATPGQQRVLAAHSRLLLAILLFILLAGLVLTFRVGRFFFPRPRPPFKPTRYPDAYAESARRIKLDDEDPAEEI